MSKGQTKKTREAAGNRRKLTRAEKKQIAEAIRKAKGGRQSPHRTADHSLPCHVPGRYLQGYGKEIFKVRRVRGHQLSACTGRR